MKGIVIYSSLTGNTKTLAEKLAEGLSAVGQFDVFDVKKAPSYEGYDVVLLGGWIDQGTFDKLTHKYFETLDDKVRVGLFATLGAMPDSFHGKKCQETLEGLLKGHNSLGVCLCPGVVAEAVINRVEKMPEGILPEDVRLEMIEAGKSSRQATEDEYEAAVQYFLQQLN